MSNVTAIFSTNDKFIAEQKVARSLYVFNFWGDHRGQGGAGGVMVDQWGDVTLPLKGLGAARFSTPLDGLLARSNRSTHAGIGHTCYTKLGKPHVDDIHPIKIENDRYEIHLSSDGVVLGKDEFRRRLEDDGYKFGSNTNGEVIGALFLSYLGDSEDYADAGRRLLDEIKGRGGFSTAMLIKDKRNIKCRVIAIADRRRIKPMCYSEKDGTFFVNSETYPLEHFGEEYPFESFAIDDIRRLNGGEMIIIDENGLKGPINLGKSIEMPCFFEGVYFGGSHARVLEPLGPRFRELAKKVNANPDEIPSNYTLRKCLGFTLTETYPDMNGDVLVGVPATGLDGLVGAAIGYGVIPERAFIKSEIERTFQWTDPFGRTIKVALKLVPVIDVLRDRRVTAIDDSLVYGGISRGAERVDMGFDYRKIGLKGVLKYVAKVSHLTSAFTYGPMHYKCPFEFDKVKKKLAADGLGGMPIEEVNREIEKRLEPEDDKRLTVRLNKPENIYSVCGDGFCNGCMNGCYFVDDKYVPKDVIESIEQARNR